LVELTPHGVDRRLVGGLLVAASAQARRRDRRALGHPHDLQRENALQCQVRLYGDRRQGSALPFVHVFTLAPIFPLARAAPRLAAGGDLKAWLCASFSLLIACRFPN